MEVDCPHCKQVTVLDQECPYHAGFSNRGFLYCDACPALLNFSVYQAEYVAIVGDKHPWSLDEKERRRVEAALKPCSETAGGRFRFGALPRCPQCNAELATLLKDDVHFIEIGIVVDGDNENLWQ